ncbi:MAG: hypothetical protein KKD85_11905 [Proteobacteria bacterium]|nr:hypothetical protein [Pseudomonadota bacterium]
MTKRLFGVLFLCGALLFATNLFGSFHGLRSEALKTLISLETFHQEMQRRTNESDTEYAKRMTSLVHLGILHSWDLPKAEAYHVSLPIWENWIIYALKHFIPSFEQWEFVDADKAIERGVGLCSQQSIILSELLHKNGLDANILVMDGHVMVALTQGRHMILDPDYGVVIEGTLDDARNNLDLVRSKYPSNAVEGIVSIYAKPHVAMVSGVEQYHPRRFWLEPLLYAMKWLLPLLLMVPRVLLRDQRVIRGQGGIS